MASSAEMMRSFGLFPPSNIVATAWEELQRKSEESWSIFVAETQAEANKRRAERLQATYQSIGIPARFRGCTLATFEKEAAGDHEKRLALHTARRMAESRVVDGKRSLIFWGESRGVGKTGLATAVFAALVAQAPNTPALWLDYHSLLDIIRQGYRSDSAVDPYALIQKASRVDLLLLDHFGSNVRSAVSEAVQEITAKIIYARHLEDLPTLLTTNLSPDTARSQLGEDTYQRLSEMGRWVRVAGRVLRQL